MADAVHNSYDPFFRSPPGAVICGQEITLRLRVDAARPVERAELIIWSCVGETRTTMAHTGTRGAWQIFEARYTAPDKPELLWYHFFVRTQGGTFYAGNAADGLGGVGQCYDVSPRSYQITVYERDFETPRWMRDGILYQIFTDRFFDGRGGKLLSRRPEIHVHEDWYESPERIIDELPGELIAIDFFGGNLAGIERKLDYLESLGVTALYLNPIFQANSNHKYDTGDYSRIDPTFGDDEDFRSLCAAAEGRGMRVILDGVFSHTGEDSLYFNRYGRYPSIGAYQSEESPFADWYTFERFPDKYACWWGVPSLPEVNETHPAFLDYIIRAEDAIIAKWLREGAGGWRLDVADELPDEFIEMLRARVKSEKPDACLIGEVWEDATNKVAYGQARRYALGNGLDSVMNYPLRTALIDFLRGAASAPITRRRLLNQRENYPLPMYYSLMNMLGSHDRARILNVLAGCDNPPIPRDAMGEYRMSPSEYRLGAERLKLMLAAIAFLPGMPCVYYGDEAGMQGLSDPYCRMCYPWDKEDAELLSFFQRNLTRRRASTVLRTGDVSLYSPDDDILVIVRTIRDGKDVFDTPCESGAAVLLINRGNEARRYSLDCEAAALPALYTDEGDAVDCPGGFLSGTLKARGMLVLFS